MADPADFFKDQLPQRNWSTIPTVLKAAYAAAAEMMRGDPILQIESAQDNKGRVISCVVDFGLKRAIENSSLPCDFRWQDYAKPTGPYLELRVTHSTASVSQVEDPSRRPCKLVFRENACLRVQNMFEGFKEEEPLSGVPHFILVHGGVGKACWFAFVPMRQ